MRLAYSLILLTLTLGTAHAHEVKTIDANKYAYTVNAPTVNLNPLKCETIRQHNEIKNTIETVQVCWNESVPDYDRDDTVTETIIKSERY